MSVDTYSLLPPPPSSLFFSFFCQQRRRGDQALLTASLGVAKGHGSVWMRRCAFWDHYADRQTSAEWMDVCWRGMGGASALSDGGGAKQRYPVF